MISFISMKEQLNTSNLALCLFGNDEWIKRKAVANVCDTFGVFDDGFSVDKLDGANVDELRLACFTPSMFCATKVVVCTNFVFGEGNKQAETKKQLAKLISGNDGSFCIVFVCDSDKFFASVDGVDLVCCNKLDKSAVIKWITSFARKQGVEVDKLCADKLATYCLCDMSRVSVETQKLIDYGQFTSQSIDLLVHKDAEYVVYDLSGAIASKNTAKALQTYKGLVARGEEKFALFGLLYNYYRRMYYVKTCPFSAEEMATFLGVKVSAISFAKEASRNYKPMQLKRALDYFVKADKQLKQFVDDEQVMTTLIMQLSTI